MKVLSEVDVSGKRVFLRADLDVPSEQLTVDPPTSLRAGSSQFTEAARLKNFKPTVDYLLEHRVKQIIIAGHIDRPTPRLRSGKPIIDPAFSTKQLLPALEKILGQKIEFRDVILGSPAQPETPESDSGQARVTKVGSSPPDVVKTLTGRQGRTIILLENLRFWPGEETNDREFAGQLASMADIYINEAFGVCHRKNASVVALPSLISHGAGLHLAKEVEVLSNLLRNPKRPFVTIIGGAKIETKIPVIENLAKVADFVLVGGKIAQEIQKSHLRQGFSGQAKVKSQKYNSKIKIAQLNDNGKDINRESIDIFKMILDQAKTIVWNGPMGIFEEGFETGTRSVADAIINSQAFSVVGGGETVEFLASYNLLSKFSFVSVGGGAMLEFLSGKELPGLLALK